MINKQFYPTPSLLTAKVWEKVDGYPDWLLEPSAGRGNLLEGYERKYRNCDVIELDLDNASILRAKSFKVVGNDFLNFRTSKQYTHIIMNPPFSKGTAHVMHAWDNILTSGQIVAIINAENIRNPNDKHKQRLVKLLEEDGNDIEYIKSAFMHEDVMRRTTVEIALISLHKKRNVHLDYTFLADLTQNDFPDDIKQENIETGVHKQLAIPQSVVKRAVLAYNAACRALRREIDVTKALRETTNYYSNLLEKSLLKPETDEEGNKIPRHSSYHNDRHDEKLQFNERADELKQRGWTTVLKQTEVGKSLSSAVMNELTRRFEEVKALEFTEHNIISFLQGLSAQASDMQMHMLSEVHRSMISYGFDNSIWYKGWRSNDKHRVAFRVRSSRIILPLRRSYMGSLSYTELETFKDIDKAMDLLAGNAESSFPLAKAMEENAKQGSERVDAGYFQIRMYSSSIHLFPQNRALIDKLNLAVGRFHRWIPTSTTPSEDTAFWKQYNKAEQFQRELLSSPQAKRSTPWQLLNIRDNDSNSTQADAFNKELEEAASEQGFDMNFDKIESEASSNQLAIL